MLDANLRESLLSLSTALLVDARDRLGLPESHLDPGIRPAIPFCKMVGTAVTVRLDLAQDPESADLTPLNQAYESQSGAGAIIVIQVPTALHAQAIFGEGSATFAGRQGFVGALVEGGLRDTKELRDMNFPAFSRTIAPGYIIGKASAVAVGEPVTVGGRTIRSGDVIVGDNDGVIVIEPDELDEVVARAVAICEWETRFHAMLADGVSYADVLEQVGPTP